MAYAEPERAPKPRHRLTPKQIRFVREYVIHGNGSEAARKAGYKHGNSISQQAAENLRKPHLKAALAQEIARMGLEITPQRVQRRLVELSTEAQGAGQFGPAVRAEEPLGKSIGMWIDQSLQLSGALNGSHVAALLEQARKRQLEPIDNSDDGDDNGTQRQDQRD